MFKVDLGTIEVEWFDLVELESWLYGKVTRHDVKGFITPLERIQKVIDDAIAEEERIESEERKENEMLTINGWMGEEKVFITRDSYSNNGNTAICLYCEDGAPWATLTVNLEGLPSGLCYLDTNNVPNAEEFVQKYGIGSPTGLYGQSGFCEYPLYQLNLDRLNELVEQSRKEIENV